MPRHFVLIGLLTLAAIASPRPAAAIRFLVIKEVTPVTAKADQIAVQAAPGKDEQGDPIVHFRVVRQIDPAKQLRFQSDRLSLRKAGKLVFSSDVTPTHDDAERTWSFRVGADFLAESKFAIEELHPPYGSGSTLTDYQIKLQDFFAAEKLPAETLPAGRQTDPPGPAALTRDVIPIPLTPANAKEHHLLVTVEPRSWDNSIGAKAVGGPHVAFVITQLLDQPQPPTLAATLTVRKAGRLVAFCEVPLPGNNKLPAWKFEISPDYLEESVVEIAGTAASGIDLNYRLKLADFYATDQPAKAAAEETAE